MTFGVIASFRGPGMSDAASLRAEDGGTREPDRWALLESHRPAIDELREALGQTESTDQELLAYLRATNFDLQASKARLEATRAWRRRSDIAAKMRDPSWRAAERAVRSVLLYDYLGLDRHGRPVLVERVGAWDVGALIREAADQDTFQVLHAMAAETLASMLRPPDVKDPRGYVLIMDMQGLSVRHLRPRLASTFGALNAIDLSFFPDSLAHIFAVNAPPVFAALFGMVKPFLAQETLSKVHLCAGVPDDLLEYLGPDCLPAELGGNRKGIFPYDVAAEASKFPDVCLSRASSFCSVGTATSSEVMHIISG